jgi:hypothetical protein
MANATSWKYQTLNEFLKQKPFICWWLDWYFQDVIRLIFNIPLLVIGWNINLSFAVSQTWML